MGHQGQEHLGNLGQEHLGNLGLLVDIQLVVKQEVRRSYLPPSEQLEDWLDCWGPLGEGRHLRQEDNLRQQVGNLLEEHILLLEELGILPLLERMELQLVGGILQQEQGSLLGGREQQLVQVGSPLVAGSQGPGDILREGSLLVADPGIQQELGRGMGPGQDKELAQGIVLGTDHLLAGDTAQLEADSCSQVHPLEGSRSYNSSFNFVYERVRYPQITVL